MPVVRVGDKIEITKRNTERTVFGRWELPALGMVLTVLRMAWIIYRIEEVRVVLGLQLSPWNLRRRVRYQLQLQISNFGIGLKSPSDGAY